jgi:hypothetical protein
MYSEIFKSISDITRTEVYQDTEIRTFMYLRDKSQLKNIEWANHCIFVVTKKIDFAGLEKVNACYSFLLLSEEFYKEIKEMFPKSNLAIMLETDIPARKRVFSAIQNSYIGNDYIGRSMMRITYLDRAEVSIDALLQETYAILQNPLIVFDATLSKIAEAGTDKFKSEQSEESIFDYDFAEYINDILSKKETSFSGATKDDLMVIDNLRYTPDGDPDTGVFIWKDKDLFYNNVISWLMSRKNHFGYLYMNCYVRPMTASDLRIFEFASMIIANRLWVKTDEGQGSKNTNRLISFNALLSNICAGSLINNEEIHKKIKTFDVKLKNGFLLICIRTEKDNHLSSGFESELRQLVNTFELGYAFKVGEYHAVLISTDQPVKNRNRISATFDELLKRKNMFGAISRSFYSITELKVRYDTVNDFLDIIESMGAKPGICKMEDYILHHIIHVYSEKYNPEVLEHSILHDLKKMNSSDVNYYETLRTYFDSDRDMLKASKQLFIHYNTMKYRINRIREETGIDIDDASTALWIKLSFYIDDFIKDKV